ncbi:putative myo-inositol transporter [Meredithblackwellia eburnea MCA 4105]
MSKPASYEDKPVALQQHVEHLEMQGGVDRRGLINEDLVQAENEDKLSGYSFLFGYDTGALPLVGTDLGHKLSNSELEIITAGTTIGAIFGSMIIGIYADPLGRRWAMVISDVFFTIGAAVIAASYSVGQMVAGRILLGVGVGGASVIAPLYIAELAPTAIRGRCVGINGFFVPFGQVVASAVASGFTKETKHGWRILFALGVIPSVIQLCLMHWLPESPRISLIKGRRDEAVASLQRIYKTATPEILALKLRIIEDNIRETSRLQHEMSFRERSKKLWTHKPYRRAIIAVAGVQAFGQLTGYNSLLYYSGTIFGLLGFKNGSAAGLIVSGGNAIFNLLGSNIVDRVGRRRLLLIAVPMFMFSLAWAIASFHFLTQGTGGLLVEGATYPKTAAGSLMGAICCFVIFFGVSLSHLVWYQSEFLPLEIRAAGSAISSTCLWLANLIISVSFLSLLTSLTPMGTYGLYLGFCTVGGIFVYFCYPETKGLSIDETDQLFLDGYGIKKSEQMRAEKLAYKKQLDNGEPRA